MGLPFIPAQPDTSSFTPNGLVTVQYHLPSKRIAASFTAHEDGLEDSLQQIQTAIVRNLEGSPLREPSTKNRSEFVGAQCAVVEVLPGDTELIVGTMRRAMEIVLQNGKVDFTLPRTNDRFEVLGSRRRS